MNERDLPHQNYRISHQSKGEEYHNKFSKNVYRAIIWEFEQEILLDILKRQFPDPSRARLLDFACGTGRLLGVLESNVGSSTGVDVAPTMLAVAGRILRHSRLICSDITRSSDLDNERFDFITAFRFFPNAEPNLREEAFEKLSAMLEPEGLLVFNNHLRCGSFRHRLLKLLRCLGYKRKKQFHCMSDEEAIQLAARHGFTLIEEHHIGILPILKERRPFIPAFLIRLIERIGVGMPGLAHLSSYKVYVVKRARNNSHDTASVLCS